MAAPITTAGMAPAERSRHWHHTIGSTYFPLDLRFRHAPSFSGELVSWQLGAVALSRLTSEALEYRRLPHHFRGEREEHFLVTVPARAEVHFSQCGKDVRCAPGGFILERSHEPYVFSHADPADLWVMKIEARALGQAVRQPDRFCSLSFTAREGAGGLLTDMLPLIPGRFDAMTEEARTTVGRQLIDLLGLALKSDPRTLMSSGSSVRAAHLIRIESFVRRHLGDAELDPGAIARASGVSTRYLHELFRDTGQTIGGWIRDQRLDCCRAALEDPSNCQTMAEIAYRFGFSDQAQFSRAFKARFGAAPKDHRRAARLKQGE